MDADLIARQIPRERKLAIVVQARMGSGRFPGKVILPLAGIPLWWHVMQRCEAGAKLCDAEIVGACVATGGEQHNDILETQARQYGYDCVRHNPEKDLCGRILKVFGHYDVDTIVLGNADSPFSWWEHTALSLRWYWETGYFAQPMWTTRQRDPQKTVTQVAGTTGVGRRVDSEQWDRVATNMDERECAFVITQRDPTGDAVRLAAPLPPSHMLYDFPQEMYDYWRWWTIEVDNYEDGVQACILYDYFYDPKTKLVDTRNAIKFVDLHPEWHYNKGRAHSAVNAASFAYNAATRDAAWLAYCEQFRVPEGGIRQYCATCNEYIGYTVSRGRMHRLYMPDGSVVTGDAEMACSKGHLRVWNESVPTSLRT